MTYLKFFFNHKTFVEKISVFQTDAKISKPILSDILANP